MQSRRIKPNEMKPHIFYILNRQLKLVWPCADHKRALVCRKSFLICCSLCVRDRLNVSERKERGRRAEEKNARENKAKHFLSTNFIIVDFILSVAIEGFAY